MNIEDLDALLTLHNGSLTLAEDTLPGDVLGPLLRAWNGDQPIVIAQAHKQRDGALIHVTGTASFLRVPSLAVIGVFTVEPNGAPVATLRFTLIAATPGPNPWRFSQSFPGLPGFPPLPGTIPDDKAPRPHFLDALPFFDAAFVLTTAADGKDAVLGVPLSAGLNFVARMRPRGFLGVLGSMLGDDHALVVHGTIVAPQATLVTPPLPRLTLPWQASWPVPGISLQADLGIDMTLAGSKLRFHDTAVRIYIPPAGDWTANNPTYAPMRTITGTLAVPSAGISVELMTRSAQPFGGITFVGWFRGVSLVNLAHLADLANGEDLFNLLPDDLKRHGAALGGLSLEEVSLTLGSNLVPSEVQLIIGMPNLDSRLLPDFTLTGLAAQFTISQPFAAGRSVSLSLSGEMTLVGAPLYASITLPQGVGYASLRADATLPLSALFKEAGLPAPADLTINTLELSAGPGATWSASAMFAAGDPWTLPIGPEQVAVEGLQLQLAKSASGYSGTFAGVVAFSDDLILSLHYDLPGAFSVRADLPSVKLSQLIARLDQLGMPLPAAFDLQLEQTWVLIQKQGSSFTFSAATSVADLGTLALTASRQQQWGMAIGIALEAEGLAQLPGLNVLQPFLSFVGLGKMLMVVSSLTDPGFEFPDFAAFNAPSLGQGRLQLPAQASGVVRGLNFYAQVNAGKNRGFQTLAKYLGVSLEGTLGMTLAVALPDPTQESKLFLSVQQEVQKGTTITGQLGGMLLGGEVSVFLEANMSTRIQDEPVTFDVTAMVVPTGVLISGSMSGSPIRFSPLPVQLANLGVLIGINWAGVPSLGVAGTLDVQDFNSSIALLFDATDPAKSLVAGAISDIDLLTIARALAGQSQIAPGVDEVLSRVALKGLPVLSAPAALSASLDQRDFGAIATAFQAGGVHIPGTQEGALLEVNTPGSVWHLTDLTTMTHYSLRQQGDHVQVDLQAQLYCAPQDTLIGAIRFQQGFHVEAHIQFLLIDARARAFIKPGVGVAVDTDIAKIVLWKPEFFAITDAGGGGGPHLSIATYDQENERDPQRRPPHLLVNGKLHLLGVDLLDVDAVAGTKGLHVKAAGQVNPLLRVDLSIDIDGITSMRGGGGVVVGIKNGLNIPELGHIDVDTSVNGTLSLALQGDTASASIQGGFDFHGLKGTIPPLTLDVTGPALACVADTLWTQVVDIIKKALKDPERWLGWVKDGVVTGAGGTAEEVSKVLNDVYHLSKDEIVDKTKRVMGYGADGLALALHGAGATSEEAIRALSKAGYATADIAESIGNAFKRIHTDTNVLHLDTPAGPHVDSSAKHVDVPRTHVDTSQHVDIPGTHIDKTVFGVHGDTTVTPHADTRPHVDTGTPHGDTSTPHGDTATPPHVDSGQHIDISPEQR